jgi:hypothetical protein
VMVTGRLRQRSWEPPKATSAPSPRSTPTRSAPASSSTPPSSNAPSASAVTVVTGVWTRPGSGPTTNHRSEAPPFGPAPQVAAWGAGCCLRPRPRPRSPQAP